MSHATAMTATEPASEVSYRHERSNVLRLAAAQALAGANSVVVYATAAIVGEVLAPHRALATLPISVFVVGMAVCTLPAGMIAHRHGRRAAFLAGTGCGVLVGLLAAAAVLLGSFWLLCVATFFGGAYAAVVLSFRFAAADCAPPERRARALSAVMAGGVLAGVVGPQLVTFTMDLWAPYLFAATYLAQAAVAVLAGLILLGVRLPKPTAAERAGGRPLGAIARQPRFIAAVICGVVSYVLMNFLMTAAPLAMRMCGLSQTTANLGIQWHVIAMFAPSFFTGRLISPLRRAARDRRRAGPDRRVRHGRADGHGHRAFLADAGPAGPGLELRLRRRLGPGAAMSPGGGKDAGAVAQRLRRVRDHGVRLLPLREPAHLLRLGHDPLAVVRAHRGNRPGARRHRWDRIPPARRRGMIPIDAARRNSQRLFGKLSRAG